jgi:uncharacterized membrane protein YcaP (DUF421 family)
MASVLRAIFGYLFLIVTVRLAGRRPGKQLTPFEFVMVFFMGGVTLKSMVGDDASFTNALVQITAIAFTHSLVTLAKGRWPAFGRFIDGTPMVLLRKGEWNVENMNRSCILNADVMAMARDQGLERLDQIDYALLEYNGEISIIPAEQEK